MNLQFTKMHALGNDFLVINAIHQSITLSPEHIRILANRHTGIGFDQCLLIEQSYMPDIDFMYRIYNADGREVGQCGNGARCLALFAKQQGLTQKNRLVIQTHTSRMVLTIHPDNTISVEFPMPKLSPQDIPMLADTQSDYYPICLNDGRAFQIHAVNVGNPHAILMVDPEDSVLNEVSSIGHMICTHPAFPLQTNVSFMRIEHASQINLRVYERGAGETQACGSAAVAAVVVGRLFHELNQTVFVDLAGGRLTVEWKTTSIHPILTGNANFVYEGRMTIP